MRLTRRDTHLTLLGGLAALAGWRPAGAAPAMVEVFDFAIAGGWHHGLAAALAAGFGPGATLSLRREADNPFDNNAIAVHGPDGARLGYVPRHANADLAEAMDAGARVRVEVVGRAAADRFIGEDEAEDGLVFTSVIEGDPILRLWIEAE